MFAVDAADVTEVRLQGGGWAVELHHGDGHGLHGERSFGDGTGVRYRRRGRCVRNGRGIAAIAATALTAMVVVVGVVVVMVVVRGRVVVIIGGGGSG